MNETNTAKRNAPGAESPGREPVLVPPVDIREDAERFTIAADVPGADEKSVEVTVQNRVLTLEGWARPETNEGLEPLGREFGAGRYRRDFALPDAVDADRIQARVKNGVLTVVLPKKDEVKARKIQIVN